MRELRACRELSQEELGFRAKLHRNYVGALERGEINPTFKTLRALADGLDVELSSLIRLYEEREEELVAQRRASRGARARRAPRLPRAVAQVVMPVNWPPVMFSVCPCT